MTLSFRGIFFNGDRSFLSSSNEEASVSVRPETEAQNLGALPHELGAFILDQFTELHNTESVENGPLSRALSSGRARNLREAFTSLTDHQQRNIRRQMGDRGVEELLAITRERDPAMFSESLLAWAGRRERQDQLSAAGMAYGLLTQRIEGGGYVLAGASDSLRRRAGNLLAVMQGGGPTGMRMVHNGSRFIRSASSLDMILGFAVGSAAFTGARSLVLGSLLNSPARNLLTRGFGSRFIASSVATVPETLAFWATSRGLAEIRNPGLHGLDLASSWPEIRNLFMTLSVMKLVGGAFARGGQWAARAEQVQATALSQRLARMSQPLWETGGMYAGVFAAHGVQQHVLGWASPQDLASLALDSAFFVGEFKVGGALSRRFLPGVYRANDLLNRRSLEREMQVSLSESPIYRGVQNFLDGFQGPFPPGMGGMIPAEALASGSRHSMNGTRPIQVETGRRAGGRSWQDLNVFNVSNGGNGSGEGSTGPEGTGTRIPETSSGPRTSHEVIGPEGGEAVHEVSPKEVGDTTEEILGSRIETSRRGWLLEHHDTLFSGRTGQTPSDRFEERMSPTRLLRALPSEVRAEVLSRSESRDTNPSSYENKPGEFGAALGEALQLRLRQIRDQVNIEVEQGGETKEVNLLELTQGDIRQIDYAKLPRYYELPRELRANLEPAMEMMRLVDYAIRSDHTEVLEAVRGAITPEMRSLSMEVLEMGQVLMGPRLLEPAGEFAQGNEVIGSEQGVLLIGAGDVSGGVRIMQHRVRPGHYRRSPDLREAEIRDQVEESGEPRSTVEARLALEDAQHDVTGEWSLGQAFKFFLSTRTNHSARRIRGERYFDNEAKDWRIGDGTYKDHTFNFDQDPRIWAFHQGSEMDSLLKRTVQVQFLNVRSVDLPGLLTDEYIRGLPENAVLLQSIGGQIARGGQARSMWQYQYIYQRLRDNGRDDVLVGTENGFRPGKMMWNGDHVEVGLAFRETENDSNTPHERSRVIVELLAGRRAHAAQNDKVTVSTTHWEHSGNVGKVAKNIYTLMVGYRTAEIAHRVVALQKGLDPSSEEYRRANNEGELAYRQMREQVVGLMKGLLLHNEGIRPDRAFFHRSVDQDVDLCSRMTFDRAVEVMRELDQIPVTGDAQWSPVQISDFFNNNVVQPGKNPGRPNPAVASTRNPRRAFIEYGIKVLRDNGWSGRFGDLDIDIVAEGVNTLPGFIDYYSHSDHPIEMRRLAQEVYDLFRVFNPSLTIDIPPEIPPFIRAAISREGIPGINGEALREGIEGQNEDVLSLVNRELRTYENFRRGVARYEGRDSSRIERIAGHLAEQGEIIHQLSLAMKRRREPIRVSRSPYLQFPYQSMFVIELAKTPEQIARDRAMAQNLAELSDVQRDQLEDPVGSRRVFLRVDLGGIHDRATQLGMLLRSYPKNSNVDVVVQVSGVDPNSATADSRIRDIRSVSRAILESYLQERPGSVSLTINGTRMDEQVLEKEGPSGAFYEALEPLTRRVLGLEPDAEVDRDLARTTLREPRYQQGPLLDRFMDNNENPRWPMILSYHGGALNAALKSVFTRPEDMTIIGAYDGDALVDAFGLYRSHDNIPMALNHQIMSRFRESFPEDPAYQNLSSYDFHRGMPLEQFLRDYDRSSLERGKPDLTFRVVPLHSLPLEDALSNRVPGVNPVLLRIYLEMNSPEFFDQKIRARETMFRELVPLYGRTREEGYEDVAETINRYLHPFARDHWDVIENHPLFIRFTRPGNFSNFLGRNSWPEEEISSSGAETPSE